ncbi:MAG: hypothetical protein AW12_00293 [Candidatus Accumulibacter sp. BA-94]|nr:MAG: hypothetical protein AW12_00293 [Candidatus Accumulibacter sp. BA-94]
MGLQPKETKHTMMDLAKRYLVNDLPGATIPASRLHNILNTLEQGRDLSAISLSYMSQLGLFALQQLAQRKISYEAFREVAGAEQSRREQAAEGERLARELTRLAKEAEYKARETARFVEFERERQRAEAARRARESDPKYIAKMRDQRLLERYGLDQFIGRQCPAHLMELLHRVGSGKRFSDEDVLWLSTEGKNYYSDLLKAAFHEREAEFYAAEYGRTNDPWNVVNASGHYRKCKQAKKAQDLLAMIPADQQRTPKLESAIRTTHGGVMRDLGRLDEALSKGNQAHILRPKDFRPCTLLGAVNFELGNYDIAKEWYSKAIERGASERAIDYDLRGIFLRADEARRAEIRAVLLREDPVRYKWVKNFSAGP